MSETMQPPQPMSSTAVKQLSDALAEAIVSSTPTTGDGAPAAPPVVTTTAGLNGSFDLQIVYASTTYELKVTIPTAAGQPYVFALTASTGGTTNPLATFKYLDAADWQVGVGLPKPITMGPITLQALTLQLGEGTVPST